MQQGGEEEPGRKNAQRTPPEKNLTHEPKTKQEEHRNIAPEQEQIGNKQARHEMNTEGQTAEITTNEDKNAGETPEATTAAAASEKRTQEEQDTTHQTTEEKRQKQAYHEPETIERLIENDGQGAKKHRPP